MSRRGLLVVIGVAAVSVAGCVPGYKRAALPLGEWEGEGEIVFYSTDTNPRQEVVGTYPTRLSIVAAPEFGEGGVRMEIFSDRRNQAEIDGSDRTHLLAELERIEELEDGKIALYRVRGFGLSTDDEAEIQEPGEDERMLFVCQVHAGTLTLFAPYMQGFHDTFRWRGGWLEKSGIFTEEPAESLVTWNERLKKK